MRFLFLLLFLANCGPDDYINTFMKPHKKRVIVEVEELRSYLDMFEKDSAHYGNGTVIDDLIIGFGDVDVEGDDYITLGTCSRSQNKTPKITLDVGHWSRMSHTRKMLLVYHELGHCVLNRDHVDEKQRYSIMNSYITNSKRFNSDRDYYLKELFNPDSSNDWLLLYNKDEHICNH